MEERNQKIAVYMVGYISGLLYLGVLWILGLQEGYGVVEIHNFLMPIVLAITVNFFINTYIIRRFKEKVFEFSNTLVYISVVHSLILIAFIYSLLTLYEVI